jgi:hypothetical protein
MTGELGGIRKEASTAEIEVLLQIVCGGTEEYHDKSRSQDSNGARYSYANTL